VRRYEAKSVYVYKKCEIISCDIYLSNLSILYCRQKLLQVVCFGKISGSDGHWMLNIFESILHLSTLRMCMITLGDLVILT